MSAPYVSNLIIDKGTDFSQKIYIKSYNNLPINLVGYAASSSIRKHPDSINKTADFIVSFTDRTKGMIQISLASSITNQIKPGRYLYDILMTDNAGLKKIVTEGSVSVRPGISTNFS